MRRRTRSEQGFILAALPFLGYYLVYEYELGFAEVFGISTSLVEVSSYTMFFLISTYGIAAVVVFDVFLDFLITKDHTSVSPIRKAASAIIGLIVIGIITIASILEGSSQYWRKLVEVVAIVVAFVFLPPLFVRKHGVDTYAERFAFFWGAISDESNRREADRPGTQFKSKVVVGVVLFLLVAIPIAREAGRVRAYVQSEFDVLVDESNTAALRLYGDKLITAVFDPCTKQLDRGYKVRSISSGEPVYFRRLNIGPLIAKELKGSPISQPPASGQ